jgi:hypothetical protein
MRLDRGVMLSLFALGWALSAVACGNGQPRFAICASNLGEAVLGYIENSERPYLVNVLFTVEGVGQLENFTAAHLGNTAEVVVGNTFLSSVPIQVVIDSGHMLLNFETASEARSVLSMIKAAPKEPCGAQ